MNFGILVYQNETSPSYSSVNVGDYIQSIAALNIYRKVVEFKLGKKYDIEKFLNLALKNDIDGFNFVFLKRDNMHEKSQYQGLDNVITIMNGWWMWPFNKQNELSFNFPKNLKPIFTSFHIYDNRLLNEDNIKTFKKFEPIGCRDIDTFNKLNNNNVDCYFSGCLTTTIDFYKWSSDNSGEVLLVDYAKEKLSENEFIVKHNDSEIKEDYKTGLKSAIDLLKKYSLSKKVYTSRLHCYLPCLAMGTPVEFNHGENSKLNTWGTGSERFVGLKDLASDQGKLNSLQNDFKRVEELIKNEF